jgi:short-subunit dehydrogenase
LHSRRQQYDPRWFHNFWGKAILNVMKGKAMQEQQNYAWITGATGGVGKAFVYLLAAHGNRLLLTGRSIEKLQAIQKDLLEKYPSIDVRIFACDLANEEDRSAMFDEISRQNLTVNLLVNVAGVDIQKAVEKYTQEKLIMQCRVNFEAPVSLCRFALERKAEHLDIINVSSVSGIYPMPFFAVYSATKGALTSFSLALREEVKSQGVHVTAVLPGAMPTRDDVKEQIKGQGLWGKLAAKQPTWVAEKSLRAVKRNKRRIIPGFWNKVMRVGTAVLPLRLKMAFISKRWGKIEKDAF